MGLFCPDVPAPRLVGGTSLPEPPKASHPPCTLRFALGVLPAPWHKFRTNSADHVWPLSDGAPQGVTATIPAKVKRHNSLTNSRTQRRKPKVHRHNIHTESQPLREQLSHAASRRFQFGKTLSNGGPHRCCLGLRQDAYTTSGHKPEMART